MCHISSKPEYVPLLFIRRNNNNILVAWPISPPPIYTAVNYSVVKIRLNGGTVTDSLNLFTKNMLTSSKVVNNSFYVEFTNCQRLIDFSKDCNYRFD